MSAISPTPAADQIAIISDAAARPAASASRAGARSRWLLVTALLIIATAATATAAPT